MGSAQSKKKSKAKGTASQSQDSLAAGVESVKNTIAAPPETSTPLQTDQKEEKQQHKVDKATECPAVSPMPEQQPEQKRLQEEQHREEEEQQQQIEQLKRASSTLSKNKRGDVSALGAKELKQRLAALGLSTAGCSEKSELVQLYKDSLAKGMKPQLQEAKEAEKGPYISEPCAYCGKEVGHDGLEVLGRHWHTNCYFCAQCGRKPEEGEVFLWHLGKPYCRHDYTELFATKCAGCSQAIMAGEALCACDQQWHPACFRCQAPGCGVVFNGEQYWEYLGQAFCEMDYLRKVGNLCEACQKPLDGRFMEAQGRRFHPQHFRCVGCSRPLMGKPFVVGANNQLKCTTCNEECH